ncbi:SpoIIE family protein phosphatase [Anaerolentibacter hominis]|uniref:SpoIIE family protein phosphatase n=1 Tax=Anaerolentibacter hominis TaxID=3079009 RepID=UPI0031B8941B
MNVSVDASYKSLNKHHEELCGDKVEMLKTEDSDILILADGMGSGVKANILATLTSKILGTMVYNGATIDECVETIVKTLPVCQVRQVAYSTFSILQIFHNGDAYLTEFDNPSCIFIRDHKLIDIPYETRMIEGKEIKEFRFKVKLGDVFILMSDGVIHAGVGDLLNFGWLWDDVSKYALSFVDRASSSQRMAATLCQACDDLYNHSPGDDTTVAVAKVIDREVLNLMTGPPLNKEDDVRMMGAFMKQSGLHVVCGGTSANIAARYLNKEIRTSLNYADPSIPPIATIEGLDLVTEGVLTLSRALTLLQQFSENSVDESFYDELDKQNGGSMLAKLLLEECTDVNMFVGKVLNPAHQNPDLPFDISIRMNIVGKIKNILDKLGKKVTVTYY